ncbi:MATE family efflux transporter [Pradoshia eiseniae]|uniref:Probable multidrug resistance protein NorM n=1 Tax=Pradoshia eiseniae TaxID=2064768 RepID=A0A2S7N4P1_9BACI|nr:MATE family efflux transporter [Pradoshia eiseniae]PQD96996.1 MATE family efflux transporter [Pradoshia eiseniae]
MKKIDLTTGNELSVITLLSLPLIGSSLLQFLYNFIDMLFVGGLGSDAIASVGSASFFINLGYAIQAMIVVGGGIKIAHSIGNQNEAENASYIGSSLLLNFLFGIITLIGLWLFGNQLLDLLDLNNDAVQMGAYQYLSVSAIMLFFSYFNTFFIRMFSSFGNNKQSFYISAFGLLLNIILDPIFIYTFEWGVIGAAIATLIAQILMFSLFVYLARGILFNKDILHFRLHQVMEIVNLGIPMSIQRVLFTVINIVLAVLIAAYGTDAVAAQKIGLQIESVTFIVMGSLNGAVSSFIGQNFGAKKYKRISRGFRVSLFLGITYAFLTSIIFIFFSEELSGLFTRDKETIAMTAAYLEIIGLSQIFMSMEMICTGVYTGIGMPKVPSAISIIFTFMRIPLAIILIPELGLDGIWWSIAISSFVKGVVSLVFFNIIYRRKYQHEI